MDLLINPYVKLGAWIVFTIMVILGAWIASCCVRINANFPKKSVIAILILGALLLVFSLASILIKCISELP